MGKRSQSSLKPTADLVQPYRFLQQLRDYITLMKPGVLSLVLFTGFVGMILAPVSLKTFEVALALWAIALASGGAGAINMWYDRDIDFLMKRTQNRPIPQGRISPEAGLIFGLTLSFLSIVLMAWITNFKAAALLAFSIFFYAVIYTIYLKRRTPQNIVIGGAAGAFPPMIGWLATGSDLTLEPCILFMIIFLWTPPHFWALALNKSQDYERAKVPMLPNIAGPLKTRRHILFYTLALFMVSLLPALLQIRGAIYGVIAVLLGTIFLIYGIKIFQKGDQRDCTKLFLFSILYLFLLFLGMLIDYHFGDLL